MAGFLLVHKLSEMDLFSFELLGIQAQSSILQQACNLNETSSPLFNEFS
jgi:hypothetical protein